MEKDKAKEVFKKFTQYLQKIEWNFKTDTSDGNLFIVTNVVGDDLPMEIIIKIIAERQIIYISSPLPFKFEKERKTAGTVAVCMINNSILNGSFTFDFEDGSMAFKLVSSYCGCEVVSDEFFEYLITVTAVTVDKYNDNLLMISKGKMNMEDLIKVINEN